MPFSHRVGDPRKRRSVVPVAEALEGRRLLATFDLGVIVGREFRGNENLTESNFHTYNFRLDRPGNVLIEVSFGAFDPLSMELRNVDTGQRFFGSFPEPFGEIVIGDDVAAGNYALEVRRNGRLGSSSFRLAIATDFASGAIDNFPESSAEIIHDGVGVDFGQLKDGTGLNVADDFLGRLDSIHVVPTDFFDVYLFSVPLAGQIDLHLTQLEVDPSGGEHRAFGRMYRDVDNDGLFEPSEQLANDPDPDSQVFFQIIDSPDDDIRMTGDVPGGRYAFVFDTLPGVLPLAGFNYHLDIGYARPENGGDSLASPRQAGTIGNQPVTFNEYLSSDDTIDVYRFATIAGGPFTISGSLTGLAEGSDFDIDLIRDNDGDNVVDAGETQVFSDRDGAFDEQVERSGLPAGTYFVRVIQRSGEGPYSLTITARNTDLAGNTLLTALNFGSLEGRARFADTVSSTDAFDVFRFNVPLQARWQGILSMTVGNAGLQLIRDANNNRTLDTGEVLATSDNSGTTTEFLHDFTLPAGDNYYVRVARVSGTPDYKLEMITDLAGDNASTAVTLPLTGAGSSVFEYMGIEDNRDYYKFTLSVPKQIGLFTHAQQPLFLAIGRDTNGNNILDSGERIFSKVISTIDFSTKLNLAAGTYVVDIAQGAQETTGTGYLFQVGVAPPDNAGNALNAARGFTISGNASVFSDSLFDTPPPSNLMDDFDDFYAFSPGNNGPFSFSATITKTNGVFSIQLIHDRNGNRRMDSGETLVTHAAPGAGVAPSPITRTITTPGAYYLRVFGTSTANYTISMAAPSTDTAGNSLSTARDLGAITGTHAAPQGGVGAIDPDDFYKFTVNAACSLRLQADGETPRAIISVIRDANNNLVINTGEVLASGEVFENGNRTVNGIFLPVAGTYYIRVHATGESSYRLVLTRSNQTPFPGAPFQINNSGSTKIEAEHFDNGGDPTAYHDTTAGNDNGAFRAAENVDIKTTSDTGGGFRVTAQPTEFLEYTILVNQGGNYDFDFRVANNQSGASFHIEIDGTSVTQVNIPSTGGVDSHTTITRTSIPLIEAPHVMRLAMDTGTSQNFAGSYNFITIRPSAGTGTFQLTPPSSAVKAGKSAKLALEWTVPTGGWRVLKDVDLLIKDDSGRTILRIRFNEASNTFRLYDPKKKKFGKPQTVGSSGTLSNKYATVNLATSSVQADGPNDPSVVITFDIKFKKKLRGQHLTIEAAASDDLGNADPFRLAGTIDVRR